jgi:hypothetical protein
MQQTKSADTGLNNNKKNNNNKTIGPSLRRGAIFIKIRARKSEENKASIMKKPITVNSSKWSFNVL